MPGPSCKSKGVSWPFFWGVHCRRAAGTGECGWSNFHPGFLMMEICLNRISSKKVIIAYECISRIAIFEDEMKHHWKHDKCRRFNNMSSLSAENSPSCEGNIFQHLQGIAGKYPLCFNRRFEPSQLTKMKENNYRFSSAIEKWVNLTKYVESYCHKKFRKNPISSSHVKKDWCAHNSAWHWGQVPQLRITRNPANHQGCKKTYK